MAKIIVNGDIKILPGRIPKHVEAKRNLDVILAELKKLHRDYINIDPWQDTDKLDQMLDHTAVMKKRYKIVLKTYSDAIEELVKGSEEQERYFKPLIFFLYKSSDSHSVVPFEGDLSQICQKSCPKGLTHVEFADFVETRLSEAVRTCESYITLLSQTLDTNIRSTNVTNIVQEALRIAYLRARCNTSYNAIFKNSEVYKGIFRKIPKLKGNVELIMKHPDMVAFQGEINQRNKDRKKQFQKSGMKIETDKTIYTIPQLLSFYLINTLGNHFKAAHESYYFHEESVEQTDRDISYSQKTLENMNQPEVHVSIEPYGAHHIAIVSRDNGLGINREKLENLFNPDYNGSEIGYATNIDGNGNTLYTYPLVCNFLGATLIVSSEGKYKGSTFKLILPRDLDNPRELPTDTSKTSQ